MIAQATMPEIQLIQRVLPLSAALLIAVVTVELIRRRKLREEYAMLWVLASLVLLAFAAFPSMLWHISQWLGVFYLTTLVILVFSFLSLLVLHLSMVVSRNTDDVRKVAQRTALLEDRIEQLSRQASAEAAEKKDRPPTGR